jgi:outer membrane protein assembly factor BamE (lipoprotein component of BamABCDE complex)
MKYRLIRYPLAPRPYYIERFDRNAWQYVIDFDREETARAYIATSKQRLEILDEYELDDEMPELPR